MVSNLNDNGCSCPGGDRYCQQGQATTAVRWSQQPQSPTWNLEPRDSRGGLGGGAAGPSLGYRLRGQRSPSPDRPTVTATCLFALSPALPVTCMGQSQLSLMPRLLANLPLLTTPIQSPPKTAAVQTPLDVGGGG